MTCRRHLASQVWPLPFLQPLLADMTCPDASAVPLRRAHLDSPHALLHPPRPFPFAAQHSHPPRRCFAPMPFAPLTITRTTPALGSCAPELATIRFGRDNARAPYTALRPLDAHPAPCTVCAYKGAAHKAAPAAQRRIGGGGF
jgi:hypothetical protein